MKAKALAPTLLLLLTACAGETPPPPPPQPSPASQKLQFSRKPVLVECGARPCYRLEFNAVDRNGNPVKIGMNPETAREKFRVHELDGEGNFSARGRDKGAGYTPFHVRFLANDQGDAFTGNYSMLLLDLSGSMLRRLPSGRTRFQAAQSAVAKYIEDFQPEVDHVALAPFESKRVRESIQDSRFLDDTAAIGSELGRLRPRPSGNTALYSAIVHALEVLKRQNLAGRNVSLVVLTDGKNDVGNPGDDPGLLTEAQRELVKQAEEEAAIEVITIGFGSGGENSFDPQALHFLAWPSSDNYYSAESQQELEEAFDRARRKLTNRIRLSFGPVRESKSELAGLQSPIFRVSLDDPGRRSYVGDSPPWTGPALGTPSWEDDLDAAETQDFIDRGEPPVPFAVRLFRRLTVFFGYLLLLALFWFGMPRLVWPERYIPRPPTPVAPSLPGGVNVRASLPRAPSAGIPPPAGPSPQGQPAWARKPRARDPKVTISPRNKRRPSGAKGTTGPEERRKPSEATVYNPPRDPDEDAEN